MTHTAPMPDSAGDFSQYEADRTAKCQAKCESPNVFCRLWESKCGGYEDYHYKCFGCGASWWVEGIDS